MIDEYIILNSCPSSWTHCYNNMIFVSRCVSHGFKCEKLRLLAKTFFGQSAEPLNEYRHTEQLC